MNQQISLIDSHAHVVPSVYGDEVGAVLDRARAAGVHEVVCIGSGYGEASAEEAITVATEHEGVHAAIGIHPHDASHASSAALDRIEELAGNAEVVAWGEIGLDFHYDNSPRDVQQQAFADQLERARRVDLPVVVHTRSADDETVGILDHHDAWERGVLIHCFSHTPAYAQQLLERGAWLSIPGIVTFRNAVDLQEAVRQTPLERMMIETDSPYLTPAPHRGRRNEPAMVRHVADCIASIKGVTLAEVALRTTSAARTFFELD